MGVYCIHLKFNNEEGKLSKTLRYLLTVITVLVVNFCLNKFGTYHFLYNLVISVIACIIVVGGIELMTKQRKEESL